MNKTILVTGAAGFIGFSLSKKLLELGYTVIGIDNINNYYNVNLKYSRLKELGILQEHAEGWHNPVNSEKYNKFTFIRVNLEDREQLPKLFLNYPISIVVNLAAQAGVRYSIENPETYIDSNVVGFLNILECCRNNKIEHLLYASSSSVYGESTNEIFSVEDRVDSPISLYAATKKSNELMAFTYSHLYAIPTTGLRFFTVYGPWGRPDMAYFLFTDAIINGQPIKVFNNGEMSRDFTYIDDIINGIVLLLQKSQANEKHPTYMVSNIGKGEPQSLLDFILAIEQNLGIPAEKILLPMQPGDVPKTSADISELEKIGYKSTTGIKDGIRKFIEWYKTYYQ